MADTQQLVAELSKKIGQLETQFAQLCSEVAELSAIMAPFLTRYQQLIRPYFEALANTQREIADIRVAMGDKSAIMAGEARSPLDRFFDDPDVQEQYERVWQGKKAVRPTGPLNLTTVTPEVKKMYQDVISKMHPLLTADKADRDRRRQLMGKVDEAYVKRDLISLEAMSEMYRPRSKQLGQAPQDVVEHLRDRIVMLEAAISKIEGQKYDLRYGLVAKMRAYAEKMWADEKRDLLAELSQELQASLAEAQASLAAIKERM